MSRRLRFTALVLALHAAAARADDVYVWTDASGETHYTNDTASIPEKSRRTVRKLEGETAAEPRGATASAGDASKPAKPAGEGASTGPRPSGEPLQPPPPEAIEETLHAPRADEQVSEEQWRSLFRKATERVKRAERKAQRSREELARLPGQDITTYDAAGNVVVESRYQSARIQLDEDEYQLEVAREQLHDLERAAAREAVPLEWRR